MSNTSNIIGDPGENLAALRLAKFGVFKTYFLGEKAPSADFLIEIIDADKPYHALVQVKSIGQEIRYRNTGWMVTPVPKQKLSALHKRVLPTYVAGVDLIEERVYVAPAFISSADHMKLTSGTPPVLVLSNDETSAKASLTQLKNDMIRYWEANSIPHHKETYDSILKLPQ